MLQQLVPSVIYVIRAVGLVAAAGVAVFTGFAGLTGKTPSYIVAAVSAWVIAAVALSWPRIPNAWRADPPTDRQLAYAEKLGLLVPPGITKGQLSDMISQATGR